MTALSALPPRFTEKIRVEGDCWEWQAFSVGGYGRVWFEGRSEPAYRAVYNLLVGEIPAGHLLHHRCENPACVNPAHLEALTYSAHVHRHRPTRTHCSKGHEFTPENTRTQSGHKECWTCYRAYFHARYLRLKAEGKR